MVFRKLMKRSGPLRHKKTKQITWENGHAFHDIEVRDSGHAMWQKVGVNGDYGRAEIFRQKVGAHALWHPNKDLILF
jgi:hypothetical protein